MKNLPRRGFTLIEILVVLVITGFVVTILLQALHQVFRLQTHLGREIFHTQRGAMYIDWFRQSINGMVPDNANGRRKFSGERSRMSGLTLSPLDQGSGVLAPFVWRLEFDARTGETGLYFGDAGGKPPAPPILAWQGNSGRFIYVDAENEPHESWPPFLGQWPQLPSAIYLESGAAAQSRLIVAAPRGAATPPLSRREIEAL